MGGKFNAIVLFNKTIQDGSPYHTEYDVDIVEIPGKKSNIPGENILTVPAIEKVTVSKNSNGKTSKVESKLNANLINQLKKCSVPLRKGQKSVCVKSLQEVLINSGFLNKKYKTGVYDAKTIAAIKSLQKSSNTLKVDGIFGKYTKEYLLKK